MNTVLNKIEHLPRQLEVLRHLPHPLHVKGMQFESMNEAKLRIREMNEVESKIVTSRGTCSTSYVTYTCTSPSCVYEARLSMKKSVIILKMLWPTIAIQEIVFHQMAKVSEPLILNNLKVTNKDISFLVTQYTMKKPNEMFISRVRAQALKNIYGDPNEEVQKLPTLESFFNDLGHSCKVLFKEPAHMLNTLEEASKFARKYELKEGIPKSFLDML